MAGAWIFFATFIALFITATAQTECDKKTCGPGELCNREKCDNLNGTCIQKEDCNNSTICPGGCVKKGKAKWCKYYRKCKCCMPDICTPRCNTANGMCMFGECKCEPGWRGITCDDFYCEQECVNGNCTGPNECSCEPGWRGPICDEFYCDPDCVNGGCTGPNECTCEPGWCGPTCVESCCVPNCQNGGTCIGINDCDCPDDYTGDICETPAFECKNAKKCNNANGICYYKSDPILQNSTACPKTIVGRYCNSRDCTCCYE